MLNIVKEERLPWEETEDDYENDPLVKRVTCIPGVKGGRPYLKDAGLTVRHILNMLDGEKTPEQIIQEYPRVTKDDIKAALRFAAWKVGTLRL